MRAHFHKLDEIPNISHPQSLCSARILGGAVGAEIRDARAKVQEIGTIPDNGFLDIAWLRRNFFGRVHPTVLLRMLEVVAGG